MTSLRRLWCWVVGCVPHRYFENHRNGSGMMWYDCRRCGRHLNIDDCETDRSPRDD